MINEKLMIIRSLFPEPVYFSELERKLTRQELKTINEYKKKTCKNTGNTTTTNNYVLEHKALKNLKEDLDKKIIDYFDKVVCTNNSIIPYITQSWMNYTTKGENHHKHSHPNSYVSGIFYINAKKGVDRIKFYNSHYQNILPITLDVTKFNIFNASSWWYPVKTGDIILFPSSLEHGVDKKKETNIRISLSFNVFIKGKIGNNSKLTELVLK